MQIRRRTLAIAAAVPVLMAGVFGVGTIWKASRSLEEAQRSAALDGVFPVTVSRLGDAVHSGVEYLNAPAIYKDAAVLRGRLYLCGPAGLFAFDENGRAVESFRVGERLPPAPLSAMAASGSELWIATDGAGVLVYDGASFRQILPRDPELRKVTAILPLSTGRIAIGTSKHGVLAYDGKTFSTFHPQLAGFHVTALAGNDADLWAGTFDRGLLHWHAGQVDSFGESDGLPDKNVLSVAVRKNRAFAGTSLGVSVFEDGKFRRNVGEGLLARALLPGDKTLLVGTLEEGMFEVPYGPGRARHGFSEPVLTGAVERIFEVEGKRFALRPDNLVELAGGKEMLPRDGSLLADRNISALSVDERGRLWVGYFDRGIDVIEADLHSAKHIEDQHLFCVNRIVHAEKRSLTAIATANGLVLMDGAAEKRQVLGRAQGLIANHVTDVALTDTGMIAATPAGLTFLDAGGPRSLYAFHGLVNNRVYTVATANGRVLAGTLGGISLLDGGMVKASYTTANSPLRHNWVSAAVAVNDGFFVGTYGGGVLRVDGKGNWTSFPDLTAPIEINPNAMTTSGERVYAGTLGRGLLVYDSSRSRWRAITEGLPSLNVTAVAAHGGWVFVGTDNGLVRIAEAHQ